MNRLHALFLILFICNTFCCVLTTGTERGRKAYACFKSLICPLLAAASFTGGAVDPTVPFLGLFFGWLGDVFLLKKHDRKFFLLGMLSFAMGHVCYVVSCFLRSGPVTRGTVFAGLAALAVYVSVIFLWFPKLKLLHGFIGTAAKAYALLLCALGFAGMTLFLTGKGAARALVPIGALLFIFSDSLLSLQVFRKSIRWRSMAVIGTYCVAQACLLAGLLL